ncbi:MAG TPA: hypothetical protein VJ946_11465 [Bacteroidales bacterium]|nr:hypothetical protein [Bacteroidales bacterium]
MRYQDIITESKFAAKPVPGILDPNNHPGSWKEVREHNAKIIRAFVQEHCQPWIKKSGNQVVYRGTHRNPQEYSAFVSGIRKNRRPRDSAAYQHRYFNTMIKMAGGVANRTNSMFVSGSSFHAAEYGIRYVVYPMGEFHYTWHAGWSDWYAETNGFYADIMPNVLPDDWDELDDDATLDLMWNPKNIDPEKVKKAVRVDRGLKEAIKLHHEILIAAEKAVYIEEDFYREFF